MGVPMNGKDLEQLCLNNIQMWYWKLNILKKADL